MTFEVVKSTTYKNKYIVMIDYYCCDVNELAILFHVDYYEVISMINKYHGKLHKQTLWNTFTYITFKKKQNAKQFAEWLESLYMIKKLKG